MALRDESLPHQIRILQDRENKNQSRVSCNCLRVAVTLFGKASGKPRYEYMPGVPKDFSESLTIYNNPENHNPQAEAFRTPDPGSATKWNELRSVT